MDYAHLVAGRHFANEQEKQARITFACYLAKEGYNLQHPGKPDFDLRSPTDVAFSEGYTAVGLTYLGAGTIFKPEYLPQAIEACHFSNATTKELLTLAEIYSKRGILDQETAKAAYAEMVKKISWNDKNISLYGPVAVALTEKGFVLETHRFHGRESVAAKKLQDEMDRVKQAALCVIPELPKLDKKPE